MKKKNAPTALTLIKAVAAADGKLKGHPRYLTKLQMITLCRRWLDLHWSQQRAEKGK